MNQPRSDHACSVVQHFYGRDSKTVPPWTIGIMVTGGYRMRGAWTTSVEFLEFRTGNALKCLIMQKIQKGGAGAEAAAPVRL